MEIVAVAVALGVAVAVLTGGSLTRMLDAPLRWLPLAFLALGAQLVLGVWDRAAGWSEATALGLFAGSFAALLVFCARNLHLTGMSVVLVGVALNTLVVAVNGAMPVRLPDDASAEQREAIEASVTHEHEDDAETLTVLGEIVVLPDPLRRSVSFGDLILGVGIVDLLFHASRVRRRGAPEPVVPGPDGPDGPGEPDGPDGPDGASSDPTGGQSAPLEHPLEGHDHPSVVDTTG